MLKKRILILFSFLLFFNFLIPSQHIVYADTAITSKMYGDQMKGKITFESKVCSEEYKKFNKNVKKYQMDDFKSDDDSGLDGLAGKMFDIINGLVFSIGEAVTNALFTGACYIGIAPSQLVQFMFFPVVLDQYDFMDSLIKGVQIIAVLVLFVTIFMSIMELNKTEGSIGEQLISKIGKFFIAGLLIASSKFLLQGIFDIANALNYFVSNYSIDVNIKDGNVGKLAVNLLNFPTLFVTYLELAFTPDFLKEMPGYTLQIVMIMSIVKIVVVFIMIKDLLKISLFGLKRLATLVSASILFPVLAALYPSEKTNRIFSTYMTKIVSTAFTPLIFGLIYLGSSPFLIEYLLPAVQGPFLKVLVLAFYLNILVSLPEFVTEILQSFRSQGEYSPKFASSAGYLGDKANIFKDKQVKRAYQTRRGNWKESKVHRPSIQKRVAYNLRQK